METEKSEISAFGKKVKKKLIDKNMKQKDLAGLLGVDYRYLNSIIYGKRSGEKYINKIVEILEIK